MDTVPPNLSVWLTLGRGAVIPDLRGGVFRVPGLTLSNTPLPPAAPSILEPLLASRQGEVCQDVAGGQRGEGKPQATFSTPCPGELTAEIHAEDWCERVKDHEMLSWKTSSQDTNNTSDTLSAEKSLVKFYI